jgi:hypothetical protein
VLAEDEIHCALDVALPVDLVPRFGEEGVLVSVQADAVVTLLGVVGREGDRLGAGAVSVFDVDIVEFSVGCEVDDGACSFIICCTRSETGAVLDIDYIACVGGCVCGVAIDSECS